MTAEKVMLSTDSTKMKFLVDSVRGDIPIQYDYVREMTLPTIKSK